MTDYRIVQRDIPKPDHPLPIMQRQNWFNLNGQWDFQFDPYDLRRQAKSGPDFSRSETPYENQILVPFCYQSQKSGIGRSDYYCDRVWYRRRFDLPDCMRGKRVILHFGGVDWQADVWLNGHYLGSHQDGFLPFSFEITDLVRDVQNVLVVSAWDPYLSHVKGYGKQFYFRIFKDGLDGVPRVSFNEAGTKYGRMTGIWQTVWLEAVRDAYVKNFKVYPDFKGQSVTYRLQVDRPEKCDSVNIKAYFGGWEDWRTTGQWFLSPMAEASAPVKGEEVELRLEFLPERFFPWSPERPDLYAVVIELAKDGQPVDVLHSYLGIREIEIRGDKLYLNGERLYLAFALDQGYFPDTRYTAPDDETLRRDVEIVKELGLNGVRRHLHRPEPRFNYWCDRIGVLNLADYVNCEPSEQIALAAGFSEQELKVLQCRTIETYKEAWCRRVELDFNYPSIIGWTLFNESKRQAKDPDWRRGMEELYEMVKTLDPTRIVNTNSGYVHVKTDLIDLHDYTYPPFLREHWKACDSEKSEFPEPHHPVFCPGYSYEGQPVYLGEVGGLGCWDFPPEGPWPFSCYGKPAQDRYEFLSWYRRLIEDIASIPKIQGFCYTQLYDLEGEVNGYCDYHRRYKVPSHYFAQIHREFFRVKKEQEKK